MDDRFSQQLKKGVLEMLVLQRICQKETYGYELITELKEKSHSLFTLKEGTLYPILYRLEDDGMIQSGWSHSTGRSAPKKIYTATDAGIRENQRRWQIWKEFSATVSSFDQQGG